MKNTVVLPYVKQTPNQVVYGLPRGTVLPVRELYIAKEHLDQVDGEWPRSLKVTLETIR